jgi:glutaconyl-CoA/methylmalonyl-CoA decarboxylase subunit gamma
MLKQFKITVNGREYNVTVEELIEGGVAPSSLGSATTVAGTMAAPVAPPRPASSPASSSAPGDEVAQLSGVVVLVDVSVGQTVKQGERLLLVEAMKMKSPVIASRSGTVTRVLVKAGDAVASGQALVTIG